MNTLSKTEGQSAPQTQGSQSPQGQQRQRTAYVMPPANIVETPEGYVLEAEMPGVSKDGLEITIENGELTIVGHRTRQEVKGRELFRESRGFDYRRVFEIDPSIDAGRISARVDQGLLILQLPKAESVKPRKIEVS